MPLLIRRLLLAWLSLLAALLLSQRFAPSLGYGLMLAVAAGCPVVAGLLLWVMWLRLREAWRRAQVLRRTARWKRPKPSQWPGPDAGQP
jgi:hypothetical protein